MRCRRRHETGLRRAWCAPDGADRWSAAGDGRLGDVAERHVAVDLGLARQAEHALADDVALDLVGAAADRREEGVQRQEVGVVAERVVAAVRGGPRRRRSGAARGRPRGGCRDIASLPSDRIGDDEPCSSWALARWPFQRLTVRSEWTRAMAWRIERVVGPAHLLGQRPRSTSAAPGARRRLAALGLGVARRVRRRPRRRRRARVGLGAARATGEVAHHRALVGQRRLQHPPARRRARRRGGRPGPGRRRGTPR